MCPRPSRQSPSPDEDYEPAVAMEEEEQLCKLLLMQDAASPCHWEPQHSGSGMSATSADSTGFLRGCDELCVP